MHQEEHARRLDVAQEHTPAPPDSPAAPHARRDTIASVLQTEPHARQELMEARPDLPPVRVQVRARQAITEARQRRPRPLVTELALVATTVRPVPHPRLRTHAPRELIGLRQAGLRRRTAPTAALTHTPEREPARVPTAL